MESSWELLLQSRSLKSALSPTFQKLEIWSLHIRAFHFPFLFICWDVTLLSKLLITNGFKVCHSGERISWWGFLSWCNGTWLPQWGQVLLIMMGMGMMKRKGTRRFQMRIWRGHLLSTCKKYGCFQRLDLTNCCCLSLSGR